MGGMLSQPNRTKKVQDGSSNQLKFCCMQMQGWERRAQNSSLCDIKIDANNRNQNSLFAIFDGHRGFQVSYFLKETFTSVLVNSESYLQGQYELALKQAFSKTDELIRSQKGQKRLKQIRSQNNGEILINQQVISDTTGCTASVVLITKKKIFIANIGNIKTYMFKDNKAIQISNSHNLDKIEEKIRVQKAGGSSNRGRINGDLNISRGFGFYSYKQNTSLSWDQQMVTCCPTIKCVERAMSDQFIFLGCQGIWQRYQRRQSQVLTKISNSKPFKDENYKECLQKLFQTLIAPDVNSDYGHKNMTGLIIKFSSL